VKYKGFEFFGTLEFTSGGDAKGVETSRSVNQYAGDLVYRFGTNENLFIGAKYNLVDGKLRNSDAEAVNITRFETSAGWFMTKNIL
ncbi:hypothetical protein NYY89_21130, partial [Acinetobacter baumannii]|nr:hypothetical protein [Acinetobacter baumannii]